MAMDDDSQARRGQSAPLTKANQGSAEGAEPFSPGSASAGGLPLDESVAERLREFASEHREVLAIYVFGSEASGTAGPLSDIDVALLLSPETLANRSAKQPFGARAAYTTALQAALQRPDVDVVLLHQASPLLAHRVIAQGRLVFCRDDRARAAFHARTLMRYLDTRPLRQLGRAYLHRRIADDRFGRAPSGAAPAATADSG